MALPEMSGGAALSANSDKDRDRVLSADYPFTTNFFVNAADLLVDEGFMFVPFGELFTGSRGFDNCTER